MLLWSIHTPDILDIIERNEVYVCDPQLSEHITDFSFGPAYDWLAKQLEVRVGPRPSGVSYPVWAWHTLNWRRHKPDLRESGWLAKGQDGVLLTLDVPDNQVLLSDFDAWHWVINGWFLSAATNEIDCEKEENAFNALPESEKQLALHQSWEHIFDIATFENDWTCHGKYIQATFWELKTEYIKSVQQFKAR